MKRNYIYLFEPVLLLILQLVLRQFHFNYSDLTAGIIMIILHILLMKHQQDTPEVPAVLNRLLAVTLAFSYTCALILLAEGISSLPAELSEAIEAPANQILDGASVPYLLSFLCITPVSTALVFHCGFQKQLRTQISPYAALLISAFLYAGFCYIRDGSVGLIIGMITGLLFSFLYEKLQDPVSAVIAHIASALAILMSYLRLLFETKTLLIGAAVLFITSLLLFVFLFIEDEEEEENQSE